MRQAGLSVMALAGLMIVGAPIAQAGITCKVVPSWCPGGGAGSGNSDKSPGGGNRVAWNGTTSHSTGNTGGSGDAGNAGNKGNTGNGGNGGTNTAGAGGNGGTNSGGNGGTATGSAGNGGANAGGTGNGGSQGNGGTGAGGAGNGGTATAPTSVPEPASLLLLGAGVSAAGAAVFRRRKSKKD